MKDNKHIGSRFEDWCDENGVKYNREFKDICSILKKTNRLFSAVNGYIVSTVLICEAANKLDAVLNTMAGLLGTPSSNPDHKAYETKVFTAKKDDPRLRTDDEVQVIYYDTSEEAVEGHMKMCVKYDEKDNNER